MKKFGYEVRYTETVTKKSSKEPYGLWESSQTNNIDYLIKDSEYPDLFSIHNINKNESCFLVWVEYSTGDSFGKAYKGGLTFMGIFKSEKVAQELVDAINNQDFRQNNRKLDEDERYSLKFTTSDGQVFYEKFVPWAGYFEKLEKVKITAVSVLKNN